MSRAVVTACSGASVLPSGLNTGRPFGLTNFVFVMPRRTAVLFIMSTKLSTDPPTFSASMIATSFADFTISALTARSTLSCAPSGIPSLLGGWLCESVVEMTTSSGES